MNLLEAVGLGIVEGLTEFLPVSSTGHLTITEKLMGLDIDSDAITGFTAVVQIGAIAAVLLYFREDIIRLLRAGLAGVRDEGARHEADWRLFVAVIVGSIPVGLIGFAARDLITGDLRSLWVVGVALIGWSAVMIYAERTGTQSRGEAKMTMIDALVMGSVQCFALIPGVSRSAATISAGLIQGLDRVAATRMAFFLGIPSLVAAGLYELKDVQGIGVGPTVVGTLVSFVVAYASVAWLLRFVAHHSIVAFIPYRVGLGLLLLALLATGVMSAT